MGLFSRFKSGNNSNPENPNATTEENKKIIRMQQNLKERLTQELKTEITQDENFESKIREASNLRDVDSLIRSYEERHNRIENEHEQIESKTKFLENTLRELEEKGIKTVAVRAAENNVSVLERIEEMTEKELRKIDEKLQELDKAVRKNNIDLESAEGKLYKILEHEEDFIKKIESQMEHEWRDQYR